jgi:hypothetical protein
MSYHSLLYILRFYSMFNVSNDIFCHVHQIRQLVDIWQNEIERRESKTKQNKTKQNKTEQNKTKQNRIELNWIE